MSAIVPFTTSGALAREARAVIHVGITITGQAPRTAGANTATATAPTGKRAAPAQSPLAR